MIRAHHCAHARPSSGTMSPLLSCVLCTHPALRCRPMPWMGDLRARSPDGGHICLYVLVVRYIGLVCPGIGLAGRGGRRAPSRRRPSLTTHAAGSKFAFERPMGGSLLDVLTNAALASVLQAASLRLGNPCSRAPGRCFLRLAHCRTDSSPGTRRDKKNRVFTWIFELLHCDGDGFRGYRVGDEVYRCLLPILWHDNHTQIFS